MPAGDPHFTGFDGQHYDVMGEPGKLFNIISTPHFQCNCRFTALDNGSTIIDQCGLKLPGTGIFFDLAMEGSRQAVWLNHGRVLWSESFPTGLFDHKGRPLSGGIQVLTGKSVVHTGDYVVEVCWCDDHGEPHPRFGPLESPHLDVYLYPSHADVDLPPVKPHGLLGVTARGPYTPTPGGLQGEGVLDVLEPGSTYRDYEVSSLWADDFQFNLYRG